jgi:putative tricarboxylic transport membrane protein
VALVAACTGGGGAGAYPTRDLNVMAPAAPGGGWDSTARALSQAMKDGGVTNRNITVYNREGAGGTVGLAEFVGKRGDPHEFMVMGLVMLGAIVTNKSPVNLDQVTPLAALTTEWEAIAVAADSEYQTFQDLVDAFKADPEAVPLGGGSAGGTDHIVVGLIAKAAGVDPKQINYVPHSGGGELTPAILSGAVKAGISGASEFADQVEAGEMRLLAVTSDAAIEGIDAPTIKESGLDVVQANWRGIVAPPGLSDADKQSAVALIQKLHDSDAWKAALDQNGWQDFFKPGDEFGTYLGQERTKVEGILKDIGLAE